MQIKQAVLQTEKDNIKTFLAENELKFRQDVDYSFYAEIDGKIVGTVSLDGNLILQLAVDKKVRGENLALKLVDHAITILRENKIYGYKVFTKPEYKDLFLSLGLNISCNNTFKLSIPFSPLYIGASICISSSLTLFSFLFAFLITHTEC